VPVLTRRAGVCHGRIGESLLRAVGMPEMVMADDAAYVARAIEIGRDAKLAARLRRKLVKLLPDAAYFNARRFAHGLETALLAAWQRTAAGERRSFDVRN
jgi:predicted O-linked N-acetylglucosamine transferase (SPINDLY family)